MITRKPILKGNSLQGNIKTFSQHLDIRLSFKMDQSPVAFSDRESVQGSLSQAEVNFLNKLAIIVGDSCTQNSLTFFSTTFYYFTFVSVAREKNLQHDCFQLYGSIYLLLLTLKTRVSGIFPHLKCWFTIY